MIRWAVIKHLAAQLPTVVNIDVLSTLPVEFPNECVWLDSPRSSETGVPTFKAGRLDLDDEFVVPLAVRIGSKLTADEACIRVEEIVAQLIEWVTTYPDLEDPDVDGVVISALITGIEGPQSFAIPEGGVLAGAVVDLTVSTRIGASS